MTDESGYCYYKSGLNESILVKLDISQPLSPQTSIYSPTNDFVRNFGVTPEGHIIYSYNENNVQYYRIKKTNGQLESLPMSDTDLRYWIGLDGKIKYHYSGKIYTLTIDPNTYELSTVEQTVTLNNIYPTSSAGHDDLHIL